VQPTNLWVNRTLTISDGPATGDKLTFLNANPYLFHGWYQYDIYVSDNEFNYLGTDIGGLFDPRTAKLGTLTVDGQQVYFAQQSPDYVPYPSGTAPSYIPATLLDKTNAYLFNRVVPQLAEVFAPQRFAE
jgi:hypothetical protein